jgi:hypothetical protein
VDGLPLCPLGAKTIVPGPILLPSSVTVPETSDSIELARQLTKIAMSAAPEKAARVRFIFIS